MIAGPNHPVTPELCRSFVALEDCNGSLNQAAARLGEATPNVSKRLKVLLNGMPPYLPRPWLKKQGKRFQLTEEGQLMLPHVRDLVENWKTLLNRTSEVRGEILSVACGQEAAGTSVLEAAKQFRIAYPKVLFKIAVIRSRRRLEGLKTGVIDIALVTQDQTAAKRIVEHEIQFDRLKDDELILACAAKSEWAKQFPANDGRVSLPEVMKWPMVLPEADSPIRVQWDVLLRRVKNAMPNVAVEVGGWRVMLGYVLAGFGVGLIPRSVALEAGAKLRVCTLDEKQRPVNRLSAVSLKLSPKKPLVQEFIDRLLAVQP
jgi:DNA-binding transcriptional LysR family regulator